MKHLEEIKDLRTYNAKTFRISGTKERIIFGYAGIFKQYYGSVLTEFHVKPIHYFGTDNKWHNLDEVASYFGNRNGMVLRPGWEGRINMSWLVWYMKRQELLGGRGVRTDYAPTYYGFPVGKLELPLMLNTACSGTSGVDCFPDPDPESTSVDGHVGFDDNAGASWTTVHDEDGSSARVFNSHNASSFAARVRNTSGQNFNITRAFILWDTSSIPDGNTIDSATASLWFTSTSDTNGGDTEAYITIIGLTSPATDTALVDDDYDQCGSVDNPTKMTGDQDIGGITTGQYTDYTVNSTGLSNISQTSRTRWGARVGYDIEDVSITVDSTDDHEAGTASSADETGTSQDPKLNVVHSTPHIRSPGMSGGSGPAIY